jgi:L-rhamnose-H+ transport protein
MQPMASNASSPMELIVGPLFVLTAGILQGSFILPMTLTREWKWEHTWATFSLLGMLVFNWTIGISVLPRLADSIRLTPSADISVLLCLGGCWGVGALLFGLGMEKLGMAVGYPVIMGLVLSLGALIPLAQFGAAQFSARSGVLLLSGTCVALSGIVLCSRAAARKNLEDAKRLSSTVGSGLTIAVFAGILSCLPNVGLNNAAELKVSATRLGATPEMAGTAAWVVQFTAGFVVDFTYCVFLIVRRRRAELFRHSFARNLFLVAAMAMMWIGSFYLYAMGAARMGRWGAIIGWPIFISLAIFTGNLWGLARGEWSSASQPARAQLNRGLSAVLVAVALFGFASALH